MLDNGLKYLMVMEKYKMHVRLYVHYVWNWRLGQVLQKEQLALIDLTVTTDEWTDVQQSNEEVALR